LLDAYQSEILKYGFTCEDVDRFPDDPDPREVRD
jgi:hypothetical protein